MSHIYAQISLIVTSQHCQSENMNIEF